MPGKNNMLNQILETVKAFTISEIKRLIRLGGVEVSKEQGDERNAICKTCDNTEGVNYMTKCKACGCFIDVMPYFEKHILKETDGVVRCKHPNGDKWIEVEKKYNDLSDLKK